MAKVSVLEIAYAGKIDKIFIRRPRFSTIMKLAGIVATDTRSIDPGAKAVSAQEKMGEFFPKLIAETVSDENGKVLFTPEQVDAWTEDDDGLAKIMAYGKVINTALNPPEETVAGK